MRGCSHVQRTATDHLGCTCQRRPRLCVAPMVEHRKPPYVTYEGSGSDPPNLPARAFNVPLTSVAHLATVLLGCAPKQGSWTYFAALLKATEKRHVRGVSEPPMDLLNRG